MTHITLSLLGAPRIERDGAPVHMDTRKAIALLAYLAVQGGYQSRETLAALLWAENDHVGARAALRRTLSTLNSALDGVGLQIEREAVALVGTELVCDLLAFQAALNDCQTHGHPASEVCLRCQNPLTEAARLYKGDFLQGFSLRDSADFDLWQFQQSEYFRRLYGSALERLVHWHMNQGSYETAVTFAQRWLALDSLHEPAHRLLIRLFAWSGQRSLALRQYRECVRILDEELGVSPLEETTRLYQLVMENTLEPPAAHGEARAINGARLEETAHSESGLPLVGRAGELRQMRASYARIARHGIEGALLVVEGEAGIGKTHLTDAFLTQQMAEGVTTLLIRCYESEIGLAYAPYVRALRTILQRGDGLNHLEDHWWAELARLLPELLAIHPHLAPAAENIGAQSRLFEAIYLALSGQLSDDRRGILVFEDAQWADNASLDLLGYMLRRSPDLLLLTWRTEDVPRTHRLRTMLSEYGRNGGQTTLVRLPRLEIQAVYELVQSLKLADDDMTERLYRESEGLPFFLAEFLTLIRSGLYATSDPTWALPVGIQDLLRSRLAVLSETARQLLSAAAVIGRSFDVDTLRECSGRGEEEVVEGLEELLRHGLIRDSGAASSGYEFYHEKLRTLVYQDASMARRRLLHRRTAQALLNQVRYTEQLPTLAAPIAYHLHASGQESEAAEYFYLAGVHARKLFANREALAHFETALALDYPQVTALYEQIGDLYTLLGDYHAAIHGYESAIAHGQPHQFPALEHSLGQVYHRLGEWELAESYYQSAMEKLAENQLIERAAVLADWSLTEYQRERLEQAQELAQAALKLAEEASEPQAQAQAHNMMGILARKQRQLDVARFHLESSLDIAASLNQLGMHVAALNNLALTLADDGQFEPAQRLFEEALKLCVRQQDRHHQAALHNNLADLFHAMKQPTSAMVHLKAAVSLFAQVGVKGDMMKPEIWKLAEW